MDDPVPSEPPHSRRLAAYPLCARHRMMFLAQQENIRLVRELSEQAPQAAIRCLTVASALVPMAQIKPRSSRPTAVTIFLLSLPVAASLAYRLCSRCCAFHAISLASSEALCCRLRNPAQMAGGR